MLPEAFLERIQCQLGEEYEAFLQSLERPRAVALRFNPLKGKKPDLPFVGGSVPWENQGYYYDPDSRPGLHVYHEAGVYYLQEASAMSAVALLDPKPYERVCDLCAAPGGKSFAAAMCMEGSGSITSCDVHAHKAELIANGANRLGLTNLQARQQDATVLVPEWEENMDVVIADVPCSGYGIIRKKPDIRYKNLAEMAKLPQLQKQILKNVADYVRPGGLLLYSTCTFSVEEN